MGCQENAVKGLVPDEVFKVERAGKELVQGTDCFERSILPKKKMRESLADCAEKGWSKKSLKMAIQVIEAEKNNSRCKAIANLLKKLHERGGGVPECHKEFLNELAKDSPITIWLPGLEKESFSALNSFLLGEVNVFQYPEKSAILNANFPYITRIISEMKKVHGKVFLPKEECDVFRSMLELYEEFNLISLERAVKRSKPKPDYKPCLAECYPNDPEHTLANHYVADGQRDKTEDKKCTKAYNSKATITGGLTHLSCQHGVVKGYTALQRGESPLLVVGPVLRRLPARVRASRRFFIYDNACSAQKSCLRRFPHRIRKWTFLVDRVHWKNHSSCHKVK